MLAISQNKFQNQYLLIALSILVLLMAIAVLLQINMPTFSAGQNLTTLNASAVSAYRWQATAQFYSLSCLPIESSESFAKILLSA